MLPRQGKQFLVHNIGKRRKTKACSEFSLFIKEGLGEIFKK